MPRRPWSRESNCSPCQCLYNVQPGDQSYIKVGRTLIWLGWVICFIGIGSVISAGLVLQTFVGSAKYGERDVVVATLHGGKRYWGECCERGTYNVSY